MAEPLLHIEHGGFDISHLNPIEAIARRLRRVSGVPEASSPLWEVKFEKLLMPTVLTNIHRISIFSTRNLRNFRLLIESLFFFFWKLQIRPS